MTKHEVQPRNRDSESDDFVLPDGEYDRVSLLLKEAEKLSNTGAWEWDILRNEWEFSDQWHEIHGTPKRKLSVEELMCIAHPDDRDAVNLAFDSTLAEHVPYEIEHRIIRQDNAEIRHVRSIGRVYKNKDGVAAKVLGAAQDITQEWQTNKQLIQSNADLERSNQELLQFSYRSSHDLKSPLTTIKGLAAFILEDIDSGSLEEAKKNVRAISKQAKSLERLVLDLLESAKVDLEEQPSALVDFESMAEEINDGFSAILKQRGVRFESYIIQNHSHVLAKSRIYQIVSNLVSNSINYSDKEKDDRFVKLSIDDSSGKIVIIVEDNGLGIPEDSGEDIYQMFKRFHSKEMSGSGIGMYIVKKQVDALEGHVSFTSSPKGTCFTVRL